MQSTNEQLMLTAMQALAAHDQDRVAQKNFMGFASPDSSRGHRLAETSFDRWTGKDKAWAFHACRKYRKQLLNYGIDFTQISEPADTKSVAIIDVKNDLFVVKFDYDAAVVTAVKTIPGRRFDPNQKHWTAPVSAEAVTAMQVIAHLFVWTEAATAMAATAESIPVIEQRAVKLITLDNSSFVIRFEYDPALIAQIRTVPAARWNPTNKYWTAPVQPQSIHRMRELEGFEWSKEALEAAEAVVEKSNANRALSTAKSVDMFEMPEMLKDPYPFQKAGILYGLTNKNCIIADPPGLGKTIQGLGIIHAANAYPALVVCPSSVTANWKREILDWLPIGADQVVVANSKTSKMELDQALIVVVGYDILADGTKDVEIS